MSDLSVFDEVARRRWDEAEPHSPWDVLRAERHWATAVPAEGLRFSFVVPRSWTDRYVVQDDATWLDDALDLAELDDGWNGPGSVGISSQTATNAARFAMRLSAVASPAP